MADPFQLMMERLRNTPPSSLPGTFAPQGTPSIASPAPTTQPPPLAPQLASFPLADGTSYTPTSAAEATALRFLRNQPSAHPLPNAPLPLPPAPSVASQYQLPSANQVFAQRALRAMNNGFRSGDPRFAGKTRSQLATLGGVDVPETPTDQPDTQNQDPNALNSASASNDYNSGKMANGQDFNRDWTLELPQGVGEQMWGNPQVAALAALQANKIDSNSPVGQRFLQQADTFREQYMMQAGAQPGQLDISGADFPDFVQGMLEHYFGASGAAGQAELGTQMKDRAQATGQYFYSAPDDDQMIQNLKLEIASPGDNDRDGRTDTPADIVYYHILAPALRGIGLGDYQLTGAQAGVGHDYQQYLVANQTGKFLGDFVDYLRQTPGTYSGSYFGH